MYSTNRTSEQFFETKTKGQKAEKTFMEMIALMGGTASTLVTIPTRTDPTPRFARPHASNKNGFCYSISPDILFTRPGQSKGFASLAQVKVKKVTRTIKGLALRVFRPSRTALNERRLSAP